MLWASLPHPAELTVDGDWRGLNGQLLAPAHEAVEVLLQLPVQRVVVQRRQLSQNARQRLEADRPADRLTIRDDL